MNNTIVWILVVVVIAGGLFFFFGNSGEEEPEVSGVGDTSSEEVVSSDADDGAPEGVMEDGVLTDEEAEAMAVPAPGNEDVEEMVVIENVVVTYVGDGFSPKEITIKKGESVTFINESNIDMWVASDIHPTHTRYPGKTTDDCLGSAFDQCARGLAGTSWEFTFDEVGSHGFHNHLRPFARGTVVVN